MAVIDWGAKSPPWNKLGPQMAKRVVTGAVMAENAHEGRHTRCDRCGEYFHNSGFANHTKSCKTMKISVRLSPHD